jgi:nucleolar pre-ribosomal-associated protein 2
MLTMIRQILTNMNEFTQSYLLSASQYAKSLKLGKNPADCSQILLLKSLAAALSDHISSHNSLERLSVDPNIFGRKLAKLVEQVLGDFASEAHESLVASLTDEKLRFLSVVLDAAQVISNDATSQTKITLPGDTLTRLERLGDKVPSRDAAIVWKLRSFLVEQNTNRYTTESFSALLDDGSHGIEEGLIYGFVDAYVQGSDQSVREQLLGELIDRGRLIGGSIGPLLAARRLLELHQGMSSLNL